MLYDKEMIDMMTIVNSKRDKTINKDIDELVDKDDFVRKLDKAIDFSFIRKEVKDLYSPVGRPSIDPVILFKMIFINIIYGFHSMRKTCMMCKNSLNLRWYLGLNIDDKIPNYSTWTKNYERRFKKSKIFSKIFYKILDTADKHNFLDLETIYGDSTNQKANANKNKAIDKIVSIGKRTYDDALLKDINKIRKEHRKKPFDSIDKTEKIFNEETGKEEIVCKTKHIKVSTTDPESGLFHKGEKEKDFAYEHSALCDGNGFVMAVFTAPGNMHDSATFANIFDIYKHTKYFKKTRNFCLDAGYITSPICKMLIDNNIEPLLPYKRPMTKKGFFSKRMYHFVPRDNVYICPNQQKLNYTTTNKLGYNEYKSNSNICKNCPLRSHCTNSKNMVKVIMRNVWEDYKDYADFNRSTKLWKSTYPNRKKTIERVWAMVKEQFNIRFTRLKGRKENFQNALLIFSCYNLKKIALWI